VWGKDKHKENEKKVYLYKAFNGVANRYHFSGNNSGCFLLRFKPWLPYMYFMFFFLSHFG